jgi:hypothetical protein
MKYADTYMSNPTPPTSLTLEEVEEIKITNSWLAQNKENGKVIYLEKISEITELPIILRNNILETAFI